MGNRDITKNSKYYINVRVWKEILNNSEVEIVDVSET